MLEFVSIENFALIDRLEAEYGAGLNLLTGETGSGKSVIVDAVSLLVGGRASQEMIREGFEKARVEGIFRLPENHRARRRLAEAGIETGDQAVIRREVSLTGVNKVFFNNQLITLGLLAEIGVELCHIHGQHDQQLLLQPASQLEFLDAFADLLDLRRQVQEAHQQLQAVSDRLGELRRSEQERERSLDLLRYQINEIEKLDLRPELDVELESERRLLASAEKRLENSGRAYGILYEDESAALAQIDRSERLLEELSELDQRFETAAARLRESRYLLEEVAHELRDYASTVENDPIRVERIEERLAEIQAVKRKYGPGLQEVLAFLETARNQVEELESSDTALEKLDRQQQDLRRQCLALARRLSESRQLAAEPLQAAVERELADLEMRGTRFVVGIETREEALSESGIDRVEFLISANPGEAPRPLARIASGGELSRIMLSLLSILSAEHDRQTLVFDEIDSGIGGRVASRLGEKLTRLARQHQVFCVTHLPQIAACADHHFLVSKSQSRKRTVVRLKRLEGLERVEEISRMLAGGSVTETTRRHAEELLQAGRP